MPLTLTAANNKNNNNNSQILYDGIIKHNCESAMLLSTKTANGFLTPEMPTDGKRFPLQRRQRAPQQQQQPQAPKQLQLNKKKTTMSVNGKFPLGTEKRKDIRQFPVQQQEQLKLKQINSNNTLKMNVRPPSTLRFPQVNHSTFAGQRFPINCQLPKKNFSYANQTTRDCCCRPLNAMSRSNVAPRPILKEFPTIKKQFVSFPNNDRQQTCKSLANVDYGNCQKNEARMVRTDVNVVPTPATTQTPTMTQMSHNMSTKIDMDSLRTVETFENFDDVSFDVHDVHKATCDNELNAHEQTLNLNVEAATEGVSERKEIEHQQAENFNDAFKQQQQHNDSNDDNNNEEGKNKGKGEGDGDDVDNDAMNATSIYAKNKHEKCEQSKLETATHNELNMTKEQQSICLASEQIQRQTIEEPTAAAAIVAAATATAAASNRQQRISDARGSSSEQVDDQQRQLVNSEASTIQIVTQTDTESSSSLSSSSLSSIEFLKCAVRDLLDEGVNTFTLVDHELFDLLSELVQLIATPTNTGNFWGVDSLIEQVNASECVDMTVSKVSDESETTAAVVDIYSEQIEQPIELDDNNNNDNSSSNNNINNQSVDMKYESLRSSSRLPETLSSRLSSTAATVAPASSRIRDAVTATVPTATSRLRDAVTATAAPAIATTATSRIRDAAIPTATTVRPLLSELKRNSTSRDDVSIDVDSLLPERTRLRRQRRMRSQDSAEEKPEDVIERINKLKARISGALSEVKGVLKQYSTESEAEAAGEKWLGPPTTTTTTTTTLPKVEKETEPEAKEPVKFRFVKKVRRRSYFDEAEEEKEKEKVAEKEEKLKNESQTEDIKETSASQATKDKVVAEEQPKEIAVKENKVEKQKKSIEEVQPKNEEKEQLNKVKEDNKQIKQIEDARPKQTKQEQEEQKPKENNILDKSKEEQQQQKKPEESPTSNAKQEQQLSKDQLDKPLVNGEFPLKSAEKDKVQAKIEFLAKVQSELKSKPKTKEAATSKEQSNETSATTKEQPKEAAATIKEQPKDTATSTKEQPKEAATTVVTTTKQQPQPVEAVEATLQTATLPKESATQPANLDESTKPATTETAATVAPKKKTIVKLKNPRRASIAAVEQSKIVLEPGQLDALNQRRPSDSEAIVKRKKKLKLTSSITNVTAKPTTSGSSNQTVATTATAPQLQQQQTATTATNEQLVAAKVDSNVSTAKRVTKPTANCKSVERDEKKTEATAATAATTTAATTTAPAAAATTATEATATVTTAPKQLPIDEIANKAPTSEQTRRASLKLAELVGETVLVVPAATAAATATIQDSTATAATKTVAAATTAAPVALSTAISSSFSETKEPINQTVIIPAIEAATTATTHHQQQQQVVAATDIEVAPVDVVVSSTPQIAATLSEVPHDESSLQQQQQHEDQEQHQQQQQQLVEATKDKAEEQPNDSLVAMPELKVLTGPVQPVKIETVEQPHDESDLSVIKKKSPHLKKLVRKSSIDKGKEKLNEAASLSNILKDKNKISSLTDRINKATPPKKQVKATKEQATTTTTTTDTKKQQENAEIPEITTETEVKAETEAEPEPELEPEVEPAPKPKKPRQIKKKVIIKRQKRRLSIGDTFFIQQEPEEPKVPEIETIEKTIAYVTDDEDDVEPEPEPEPAKPLKSCLHIREYKNGDLILYAERYRKTQVRWKRGRVLDRITSISYLLEIEGKEVPAHISYIKKNTGRKVKFVGKEYLDIDYEQVVEEERRARSYSIWNMV